VQPLETSGFAEFDRLAGLFRRTRELLDLASSMSDVPAAATEVLATETLPHVADIEEGFRVWLRAGGAGLAEMRALVLRAGLRDKEPQTPAERRAALIEAMHELAAAASTDVEILPAPARSLAALQHARLVFALLPATPPDEVHYPTGLRTYGDIAAPRGPMELSERIEELERSLWAVTPDTGARSASSTLPRASAAATS
jgi:hypothetical protein